jgi:hypothetical protein
MDMQQRRLQYSPLPAVVGSQSSQYLAVQELTKGDPELDSVNREAIWAQVGELIAKVWKNIEKRAQNTIQDGEKGEVDLWSERSQWRPCLVSIEKSDLLVCIEGLVTNPETRNDQEVKLVDVAVWAAKNGLTRFSQAPVVDWICAFVRLRRFEPSSTRRDSLQSYMSKDAIVKHMRLSRQILMFLRVCSKSIPGNVPSTDSHAGSVRNR